jgi:hypothetical protein
MPGVERCTLPTLALALVVCGGEARSAPTATVAATPEVIDSLRADLVTLIERDALSSFRRPFAAPTCGIF